MTRAQFLINRAVLAALEENTTDTAIWSKLLVMAVENEYYEQLFQLIRRKDNGTQIKVVKCAALDLFETQAIADHKPANHILLSLARTFGDSELLDRFVPPARDKQETLKGGAISIIDSNRDSHDIACTTTQNRNCEPITWRLMPRPRNS